MTSKKDSLLYGYDDGLIYLFEDGNNYNVSKENDLLLKLRDICSDYFKRKNKEDSLRNGWRNSGIRLTLKDVRKLKDDDIVWVVSNNAHDPKDKPFFDCVSKIRRLGKYEINLVDYPDYNGFQFEFESSPGKEFLTHEKSWLKLYKVEKK